MPAASPPTSAGDRQSLAQLGQQLKAARKRQKVSAVSAAEAAGMSRVTLHRIEQGEPSVTVGAWVAAASTLGLRLDLVDTKTHEAVQLPARIRLDEYPALKKLAWQLQGVEELSPQQALELYERNWRHLEVETLTPKESALIQALSRVLAGGRLLV